MPQNVVGEPGEGQEPARWKRQALRGEDDSLDCRVVGRISRYALLMRHRLSQAAAGSRPSPADLLFHPTRAPQGEEVK
jgi:hypothetical protein